MAQMGKVGPGPAKALPGLHDWPVLQHVVGRPSHVNRVGLAETKTTSETNETFWVFFKCFFGLLLTRKAKSLCWSSSHLKNKLYPKHKTLRASNTQPQSMSLSVHIKRWEKRLMAPPRNVNCFTLGSVTCGRFQNRSNQLILADQKQCPPTDEISRKKKLRSFFETLRSRTRTLSMTSNEPQDWLLGSCSDYA